MVAAATVPQAPGDWPAGESRVRQIAAVVKRPVRRVSLNGETSVADFIGHWTVNP